MDEPVHAQGSPQQPTVPGRISRLAWAIVAAAIFALLLLCAVLVLVAAWREP